MTRFERYKFKLGLATFFLVAGILSPAIVESTHSIDKNTILVPQEASTIEEAISIAQPESIILIERAVFQANPVEIDNKKLSFQCLGNGIIEIPRGKIGFLLHEQVDISFKNCLFSSHGGAIMNIVGEGNKISVK
jgi:hypothetical protein